MECVPELASLARKPSRSKKVAEAWLNSSRPPGPPGAKDMRILRVYGRVEQNNEHGIALFLSTV